MLAANNRTGTSPACFAAEMRKRPVKKSAIPDEEVEGYIKTRPELARFFRPKLEWHSPPTHPIELDVLEAARRGTWTVGTMIKYICTLPPALVSEVRFNYEGRPEVRCSECLIPPFY